MLARFNKLLSVYKLNINNYIGLKNLGRSLKVGRCLLCVTINIQKPESIIIFWLLNNKKIKKRITQKIVYFHTSKWFTYSWKSITDYNQETKWYYYVSLSSILALSLKVLQNNLKGPFIIYDILVCNEYRRSYNWA